MVSIANMEIDQRRLATAGIGQGNNALILNDDQTHAPKQTEGKEISRTADRRLAKPVMPIPVWNETDVLSGTSTDGLIPVSDEFGNRAFAYGLCPQLSGNDPLEMTSYPTNK